MVHALRTCARCWTLVAVARVSARGSAKPALAQKPAAQALTRIYEVVRAIPRGKIATYGQIAALAGIPNGHRVAARAMRECPAGLPWQRVLGKKDARRAQINIADGEHARLQRALLEREGVLFDDEGLTRLAQFGWLPGDLPVNQRRLRKSPA
jgi:methylated-DNA-protein-cysteine methyltransferase related protein